jgi:hypothetical protein
MNHAHHAQHAHHPTQAGAGAQSLNRIAFRRLCIASWMCHREVAGMVIGTHLGWSNLETLLALALAFLSGYALTTLPLLRGGYTVKSAARLALAADSASIAVMEIVDNLLMWVIPGAMDAPLDSPLFWGSLTIALLLAGAAAFPLNRWLIARGRGHALAHVHH